MISQQALKNYQGRALGIGVYGNGGLEKTLAVRTLPPPVLELDFEGGSGCLGPWTRRVRKWDSHEWLEYSQEEREKLLELAMPQDADKRREQMARALLKPAPLVDIISFDTLSQNMEEKKAPAYDELFKLITNLNFKLYNSISVDPLVEFSQLMQTKSKTSEGVLATEPMYVKLWGPAQERAAILLRVLREYRDKGIFIYMTSSEFVDKDYGTDPRSASKGQAPEEPYAIKGTLNVPGQLVNKVNHMIDIQVHSRMMGGKAVWVTREEPARSGSFNWEAKDRTGRLQDMYVKPNIRTVIRQVYGQEAYEEIYGQRSDVATAS